MNSEPIPEEIFSGRPALLRIRRLLRRERNRLRRFVFFRAALEALCAQLILLTATGILAARHPYETLWLKILLATYAVYAWPCARYALARARGVFDLDRIAARWDRSLPEAPDVFRTLLSAKNHSGLVLDGLETLYASWEPRLRPPADGRFSSRGKILAACAAFAFVVPFFSGHAGAVFYRMALPLSAWRAIPLPRLEPIGIPDEVAVGDTLRVRVALAHVPASEPAYAYVVAGGTEKRYAMNRSPARSVSDTAAFAFGPITEDLRLRFSALATSTDEYPIRAVEPPRLKSVSLRLVPPAYARLPSEAQSQALSLVSALPGSDLIWKVQSSEPLRRLQAVFIEAGKAEPESLDLGAGAEFSLRRTLRASLELRLLLTDARGMRSSGGSYRVEAKPDAAPEITLLAPAADGDLSRALKIPVFFRARDDFGIARVRLLYSAPEKNGTRVSGGRIDVTGWMAGRGGTDGAGSGLWDLNGLGLRAGDVIEMHLEVEDNDAAGPQIGRSQTVRLRLPSVEEVRAAVESGEKDASVSLSSALERQQRLERENAPSKTPSAEGPPPLGEFDVRRILSDQPRENLRQIDDQLRAEAAQAQKGSRLERQLQAVREGIRADSERLPPPQVGQASLEQQQKSLETLTRDQTELDRKLSRLPPPSKDPVRPAAPSARAADRGRVQEDLRRNLAEQKDLGDWLKDQQRQAQEKTRGEDRAAQGSERVREDVRRALDQVRQAMEKGAENGTLTPEVLEKMQRVQELMEEALKERDGDRPRRDPQSAPVAPDDPRSAVDKALGQKDDLRRNLESAIRMLEALHQMRAVENAAADLRAMAADQSQLASAIGKSALGEEAGKAAGADKVSAEKSSALAARQSGLEKRLDNTLQDLDHAARDPAFKDLKRDDARDAGESMRKTEQALQRPAPDPKTAQRNAAKAAEQLQRASAAMMQSVDRMDSEAASGEIAAALDETLEFGDWLRAMRDPMLRTREGWTGGEASINQSAAQIARWLRVLLGAIAAEKPFGADVLRREAAALGVNAEALAAAPSSSNLTDSLRLHAHRAARELLKLYNPPASTQGDSPGDQEGNSPAAGGGSGSGSMEGMAGRMRGVSGKQAAANQATFQLLKSFLEGRRGAAGQGSPGDAPGREQGSGSGRLPSGSGSPETPGEGSGQTSADGKPRDGGDRPGGQDGNGPAGSAAQGGRGAAGAQQGVADALEQLAEASGDAGGAARQLRQLAAEARALEGDLRRGRMSPAEVAKRQQQFQTRLLESADALEERGRDRKRQAEAFRGGALQAAPAGPPSSEDRLREIRARRDAARKLPLAPEQKRRVEWYYERLLQP